VAAAGNSHAFFWMKEGCEKASHFRDEVVVRSFVPLTGIAASTHA